MGLLTLIIITVVPLLLPTSLVCQELQQAHPRYAYEHH